MEQTQTGKKAAKKHKDARKPVRDAQRKADQISTQITTTGLKTTKFNKDGSSKE